eukprot:m.80928 g.80928  ORF g.80928 m.80928 type:complete len:309 (-) comp12619_c1_seq3:485-1411(-)
MDFTFLLQGAGEQMPGGQAVDFSELLLPATLGLQTSTAFHQQLQSQIQPPPQQPIQQPQQSLLLDLQHQMGAVQAAQAMQLEQAAQASGLATPMAAPAPITTTATLPGTATSTEQLPLLYSTHPGPPPPPPATTATAATHAPIGLGDDGDDDDGGEVEAGTTATGKPKRTQNKAAADKYRRKKKEQLETLQSEVDVLTKENLQLEIQAQRLEQEKTFLTTLFSKLIVSRPDQLHRLLDMPEHALADEMIPGVMTKQQFLERRGEWRQIMQDTSRKLECRMAEIAMAIRDFGKEAEADSAPQDTSSDAK